MDSQHFEERFAQAVATRGPAYEQARNTILVEGSDNVGELQKRSTAPDWRVAIQAEILLGWITNRPLFMQCLAYLDGQLPDPPANITGKFTLKQHVQALVELGPTISPCLLEILLKRRPISSDMTARAFNTLLELDHRFLKQSALLLLSDEEVHIRTSAATALSRYPDPEVTQTLMAVLRDSSQADWPRVAAAGALARHPVAEVTNLLHEIVADDTAPKPLRAACLSAIVERKDKSAVPTIIQASKRSSDEQFHVESISALGKLGDPTAIPFLESMKSHSDEMVRESVEDALYSLKKHQ